MPQELDRAQLDTQKTGRIRCLVFLVLLADGFILSRPGERIRWGVWETPANDGLIARGHDAEINHSPS